MTGDQADGPRGDGSAHWDEYVEDVEASEFAILDAAAQTASRAAGERIGTLLAVTVAG